MSGLSVPWFAAYSHADPRMKAERESKLERGGVMADIDRHELHTLVDHIPESDVPAARKVLRALADPVELAIVAAPVDDEPETEEERASVASSPDRKSTRLNSSHANI